MAIEHEIVTIVVHYPFRHIYLWYALASEASELSE